MIMSKKEKLLKKFLEVPPKKDLTFKELEILLLYCGYIKLEGKGSAVKFYHQTKDNLINLHKPHPRQHTQSVSRKTDTDKTKRGL